MNCAFVYPDQEIIFHVREEWFDSCMRTLPKNIIFKVRDILNRYSNFYNCLPSIKIIEKVISYYE